MPEILSRRRFLATTGGAVAGAVLLGACGGDDDEGSEPTTTTTTGDGGGRRGDLVLAAYLGGPFHAAGRESRVVFGLADSEGLLTYEDTPDELELAILGPDQAPVGDPITVQRHGEGLPRAYFPLRTTLEDPGIYTLRAELDDQPAAELAFEVKDVAAVSVVKPGDTMPGSLTPTTGDARGVDPICTDDTICPLHDVTLTDALAGGRPVAFLVATPGFCKVSACGPVHEVLLDVVDAHPDIHFLHAEVYRHPHVNPDGDFTQVLTDLGMFAEPSLFLVGSDGVVRERLDAIYDESELGDALAALA